MATLRSLKSILTSHIWINSRCSRMQAGYTHFPWIYKLRGELLALSAQISLLVLAPNITCTRSWLPGAHYWGPKKINTVSPTTIASSTPPLAKPVQLLNTTTTETKGQLMSKCPFGVFKSSKKPMTFFSRISALSSKKSSNIKNKGTLYR